LLEIGSGSNFFSAALRTRLCGRVGGTTKEFSQEYNILNNLLTSALKPPPNNYSFREDTTQTLSRKSAEEWGFKVFEHALLIGDLLFKNEK